MSGKEDNKPTGPRFSWKKAGNLLSEVEKNRICCLLLTCFEQIKVRFLIMYSTVQI